MSVIPAFAHPWALLLVALVPLLLVWWRRRRGPALGFSSTTLVSGLHSAKARWSARAALALRAAALGCLIVALAGPRWPDLGSRIPREGIAILLVMDTSDSMATRDFVWDKEPIRRLDAVKHVFRLFVAGGQGPSSIEFSGRSNDLVGLVTFATFPEAACPLTLDHAALLRLLDAEEPRTLATTPGEHMSNPGDAIAWGLERLQRAVARKKVMIFLSDGESNVPPPALQPRQAAQLARNLSVPIYAIDAARPEEPNAPAVQAQENLKAIASLSQGRYFQAFDAPALLSACGEIDRLERDTIFSFEYRLYHEGFLWFALASFVFWFGIYALEATVWRKIP